MEKRQKTENEKMLQDANILINRVVCEACIKNPVQNVLSNPNNEKETYRLCGNCLLKLVNCSLNVSEFKNLLKTGHTIKEFYLHGDFYDEDGIALQPHDD